MRRRIIRAVVACNFGFVLKARVGPGSPPRRAQIDGLIAPTLIMLGKSTQSTSNLAVGLSRIQSKYKARVWA